MLMRAKCDTVRAPIFFNTAARWCSAVRVLIPSLVASSFVGIPSAKSAITSCSRGVSDP